jgi:hypothetical protein
MALHCSRAERAAYGEIDERTTQPQVLQGQCDASDADRLRVRILDSQYLLIK